MNAADGLAVFSDPRSVAVVGASADPAKWGYWLARGALRGTAQRGVHLINSGSAVIEGVPSVPALTDLPEAPELIVLCTPAAGVEDVVHQGLAMGARGFLGITAGIDATLGEVGVERRLAARVRAAGARMVGPNSLGMYDAARGLELAWGTFTPGNLGVVSQSGQLGVEIAGLAAHAGLGVSRFVSVGNQVDVTAVDLLDDLVEHAETKVVVLYLEDFTAGRDLVATMGRLRDAGKPVVVLTIGASEASRLAARSHTGALTSPTDVVAAACKAAGAVLVDTPVQAVDLAHLLLGSPLPSGRRVGVVSDSGGQGALASDTLARHGLSVPRLRQETSGSLAEFLPASAGLTNPVDLAGAGEQDLGTYSRVVDKLLASGEVDAVVLSGYLGCYGSDLPALERRELEVVAGLSDAVRRHGKPVVVHSMSHDSEAVRAMRAQAVPTVHTIDAVARSLELAVAMRESQNAPLPSVLPATTAVGATVDYFDGRELIAAYGVSYPRAVPVRDAGELVAAVGELNPPYVLKAGWLAHKTEAGGVVVGIADMAAARSAFAQMHARLGAGSYVLEEHDGREDVVELIVGARRDPSFGPVVLVGLGGVLAELYRDVAVALAPVTEQQADQLLRSLRAWPLLAGWRGRRGVDVTAASRVIASLSTLLADNVDIVEAEINPLRAGPDGAVAVDAVVVRAAETTRGDRAATNDADQDDALTGVVS